MDLSVELLIVSACVRLHKRHKCCCTSASADARAHLGARQPHEPVCEHVPAFKECAGIKHLHMLCLCKGTWRRWRMSN